MGSIQMKLLVAAVSPTC